MRTRVKICCIRSVEEAGLAAGAGANLIGLVGPMPSGPGVLSLDVATRIAAASDGMVRRVLLSAAVTGPDLAAEAMAVGADVLQIVRHVPLETHAWLARNLPGVERIQAIHVEGPDAVDLIRDYAAGPDAFVLDSGRPAEGKLGGTGMTHDWVLSRACVAMASRPVYLAGGLNPGNVAEAITTVRPFGVDICSGIRTDGALDPAKLRAFMEAVRSAS